MEITRRDIANYKLLGILLEKDKKKLERYIEKRPSYYSGKVYGSNPQFPYETRGFTITGCAEYERQQMKKWEEDCRIIEEQIQSDIRYLNELELAIDNNLCFLIRFRVLCGYVAGTAFLLNKLTYFKCYTVPTIV